MTELPTFKECTAHGRFPFSVIALFVFMGLACAKMGYPPGGPTDDIPPELEFSVPGNNAINVSRDTDIRFRFTEPMNGETVEENLFLVPIPAQWPDMQWHDGGREIELRMHAPLAENTTYVISVGANAADRRGNMLEDSAMLTFSTGDTIENGRIRGTVFPVHYFGDSPEKVAGVDIAAFDVTGDGDAPDPRTDIPGYVTQSGDDGSYEMVGMSPGTYRLFAVGDKDGNGFYSEGYDMLGVPPHDVMVAGSDSVVDAPSIGVSLRDTSAVQLMSVKSPNRHRFELYFDRPVVRESVEFAFDAIGVHGWYIPAETSNMIAAATAEQQQGERYPLTGLEVEDARGNRLAPLAVTPYATGTDRPDTTALAITEWGPQVVGSGDGTVSFRFNRWLDVQDGASAAVDVEPPSEVTAAVENGNTLTVTPDDGWAANTTYAFRFNRSVLRSTAGNSLAEDDAVRYLRVAPEDSLGFIEGILEDESPTSSDGPYIIDLRHTESGTHHRVSVAAAGVWETGPVLPGRWLLMTFRDDDGDGEHDTGELEPFTFAEQAVVLPDTLQVMSRWTNGDNRIHFK